MVELCEMASGQKTNGLKCLALLSFIPTEVHTQVQVHEVTRSK